MLDLQFSTNPFLMSPLCSTQHAVNQTKQVKENDDGRRTNNVVLNPIRINDLKCKDLSYGSKKKKEQESKKEESTVDPPVELLSLCPGAHLPP